MRILQRHRALSAAFLVISLFVTAAAFVWLPWTYHSEADLALIPSKAAAERSGNGNPYLAFTGSLNELGDIVTYQVDGSQFVDLLKAEGYSGDYTISDAPGTQAPILVVQVVGKDAANVQSTLDVVTGKITRELAEIQSGIPSSARIKNQVLSYSTSATRLTSKKFRPLAEIFIMCAISLSVLLALIDALWSRRRKKKHAGGPEGTTVEQMGPTPLPTPSAQMDASLTRDDRPAWRNQGSGLPPMGSSEARPQEYPPWSDRSPQGDSSRQGY